MLHVVKKFKAWMVCLLCVSMVITNISPSFCDTTNIGDFVNKTEEKRQDTLDDANGAIQNSLEKDGEFFYDQSKR